MEKIRIKIKDYQSLVKLTLSLLVAFSGVISYLLAPGVYFDFKMTSLFFTAGLLITFSANAINQILEKESDAKMARTSSRPIAAGRMKKAEAGLFAFLSASLGLMLLQYFFNWNAAFLGLLSLVLYAWVYTPMKKVNSFSVLIGAIPGAMPCLIGWIAGYDDITKPQAWCLFAIQFFWQFPHFWSIAWLAHQDYTKAGFKLLPSSAGPSKYTALQSILYSTVMIPIGFLPYFLSISGVISFFILLFCNLITVVLSIRLYAKQTKEEARRIMFWSYIYITITFLSLLLDKYQ